MDQRQVVPGDDHGLHAERRRPPPVGIEVPTELRFPALAQAIDIDNGSEVEQICRCTRE